MVTGGTEDEKPDFASTMDENTVGKEPFATNDVVGDKTKVETEKVRSDVDLAGGTTERVAMGAKVGPGEFTPEGTENCSVVVAPGTFVAKGTEPGRGPLLVSSCGSENNDEPTALDGVA